LAHRLNRKVTAEGTENLEQLSYLKDEKFDEGQGYYFSLLPLPAEIHQFPIQISTVKPIMGEIGFYFYAQKKRPPIGDKITTKNILSFSENL
jgi:hypothetical protein